MRHAIEEEEKVPMEQVINFQEVMHRLREVMWGEQSVYMPCLAEWLLSVAYSLCTYCVIVLGRRDRTWGLVSCSQDRTA